MRRISEILVVIGCFSSSIFGITTYLQPSDSTFSSTYGTSPGGPYEGVAMLTISIPGSGTFICSGSLLSSGEEILTAGHCVTNGSGSFVAGTTVKVSFDSGTSISTGNITVDPSYNPSDEVADLAVIHLGTQAPASAERYGLYTNTDEQFQIMNIVAYGETGWGGTGAVAGSYGTKYQGENRVDGFIGDIPTFVSDVNSSTSPWVSNGSTLLFDFDNGLVANDVGSYSPFNDPDLGLGVDEVDIAPGDSGGPEFISGLIAGVNVFGVGFAGAPDISPNKTNSSFGEIAGGMRVSSYSDWILANETTPEPSTLILTGCGLLMLVWSRRKFRRS